MPSTSLTVRPVIASGVFAIAFWAAGTVLTGASLTATMLRARVEVSLPPAPSLTV